MKNKPYRVLIIAALCCFTSMLLAQTDTANAEKNKNNVETILNGKNVQIVLKQKEVLQKKADGQDTVTKRLESVEIIAFGEHDEAQENDVVEDFEVIKGSEFIETKWNNFHLGLNNLLNSKGKLETETGYEKMGISPVNSVHFQWDIVTQAMNLYRGNVRLIYGIGIEYNNYRFQNDITLTADSVMLQVVEDVIEYDKNKLVTQHLNVPLLLNFKLSPKGIKDYVYVSAGANFGYRIGSRQKQVWKDNGKNKSETKADYNLEQFRIGYEVQFGYKNIVLYGKYFPNSMFKANHGPQLRTVSAGILIGKV